MALWAKTKFCLDDPPSQLVMSRIISASSSLQVEKIGMAKRNRLVEQAVSMMDESDAGKSAHAASDADEDCYVKPPRIEEKL